MEKTRSFLLAVIPESAALQAVDACFPHFALYSCAPQIHRLMQPVPPELSGERSLIVPDSGQMPSMVVSELSIHSFFDVLEEKIFDTETNL